MNSLLRLVGCSLLALALGACSHVDLRPEGNPDRVLSGSVQVPMDLMPPPDAELVVRLIDPAQIGLSSAQVAKDLVIGERGARELPETVVAQQVIRAPAAFPASFRLEYTATDAQLRHGLNLEARLWWGGKLRFRNLEAQVVTLETAGSPQTILMQPAR